MIKQTHIEMFWNLVDMIINVLLSQGGLKEEG